MAGDVRPFGELFAENTRNGLTRPKAVRGAGVKMVNMGELFAHPRLRSAEMERVKLSDSEAERFLLKEGDLLFARQSLVLEGAGKCSIFLNDDEPVTFESHVTRVRLDPRLAEPRFYFYYLQSHHGRSAITSIVEQGAGASGIRGSDLEKIDVLWRPLPEQRGIAKILGTLDDKIELNRRMSETLEAMARALFKSWFVDFDPVRANAEGGDPGLPKSIAALFPARFVDSELGEIPEGWSAVSVGGVCSRVAMGPFGSDIKTDNFVESGVPIVRGGNLKDGFLDEEFVFLTEHKADELRNANAFPGDIVITHRGTLGQVGLIPLKSRFPRYVVSQSQMLLSVDPERSLPRYVYMYLRSSVGQHALLANTSQTGVPAIARPTTSVKAIPLLAPSGEVLEVFANIVESLYQQLDHTRGQSHTLAAVRDALLPRLISGELRVKDADAIAGRIA